MSQVVSIEWPRANGLKFASEIYPLGTPFLEVPGIYVMCRQVPNGWQALYLGQAANLNQRVGVGLKHHHAFAAAKARGATHICVAQVGTAWQRDQIERELCATLRPAVNQQLVP